MMQYEPEVRIDEFGCLAPRQQLARTLPILEDAAMCLGVAGSTVDVHDFAAHFSESDARVLARCAPLRPVEGPR
jgi:hypothetical protein